MSAFNPGLALRSVWQLFRQRLHDPVKDSDFRDSIDLLPVSLSSAFATTKTPDELRALASEVREHFALGGLDRDDMLRGARADEIRGGEHLRRLRDAGHGAVIASLHFGPLYFVAWEATHFGFDLKAIMANDLQGLADDDFRRITHAAGLRYEALLARSPAEVRRAVSLLRTGGALVIYSDGMSVAGGARDRDHHSADIDFLGVPMRVRHGPAWFAAQGRVPIVPALAWREGVGRRVVEFGEPLPAPDREHPESLDAATRALWGWFEPRVRARPHQWGTWLAPYLLWRETGSSPTASAESFERATSEAESRLARGSGRLVAESAHVGVVRGERSLLLHGPERRVLDASPASAALLEAALRREKLRQIAKSGLVPRGDLAREIARLTLAGLARIED